MKAIILAGGKGTRGKPYTDYFPKAMIPINGRPIIDHIVRHLRSFDIIEEIVIVADFNGLGGQIKNYFGSCYDDIIYVQDSGNGTGGDLLCAKNILGNIDAIDDNNNNNNNNNKHVQTEFILWFVDNLCAISPVKMKETYVKKIKNCSAVIATRTTRREETGFATVDNDGTIKEFMEKPIIKLPASECLGIYILGNDIIERLKNAQKIDINLSYDILQPLSAEQKIAAHDIGDMEWIDIESPTVVSRNADMIDRIIAQMGQ